MSNKHLYKPDSKGETGELGKWLPLKVLVNAEEDVFFFSA